MWPKKKTQSLVPGYSDPDDTIRAMHARLVRAVKGGNKEAIAHSLGIIQGYAEGAKMLGPSSLDTAIESLSSEGWAAIVEVQRGA